MKNAREFREPIAWTVIVVSIGFLVAFLVRAVMMMIHEHSGVFRMARSLSGSSLGIGVVLLLLAAVMVCRFIRPATSHAALLGKVSALIVAIAAAFDLILAVLSPIDGPGGFFGAALGLFGDLLAIAVKVLAAWVLLVLTRPEAASSDDVEDSGDEPDEPEHETTDHRAVTQNDQDEFSWPEGVGAVWTRAGDAASGAGGSTWGPGQIGNAQSWASDSTSGTAGDTADQQWPHERG
ncbi:hypothetical protein [Cutibacterium sp.]|uniref:hypothetical protein n=1 Tax=Cutibacterium sp. TaxID=1912221 RepID=UPI0026DA948F|nr:hypothetical protein [Cutibacterium sp.]MDO4413337.1 hypothetical protein [Cutibacterium sp.]